MARERYDTRIAYCPRYSAIGLMTPPNDAFKMFPDSGLGLGTTMLVDIEEALLILTRLDRNSPAMDLFWAINRFWRDHEGRFPQKTEMPALVGQNKFKVDMLLHTLRIKGLAYHDQQTGEVRTNAARLYIEMEPSVLPITLVSTEDAGHAA